MARLGGLSSLVWMAFLISGCSQPPVFEPARSGDKPGRANASSAKAPSPYDAAFWQTWGDGQAEIAAYDLTMPRYGKLRKGSAVAITVSEPFSKSARIKADEGKHTAADVISAMKLNLIRSYQTGIYNYKDMLSAFIALDESDAGPAGAASKITYSSQEWCGHVWSQVIFHPGVAEQVRHSYFDGEGDAHRSLTIPAETVAEDALMLAARRIAWPRLQRGQSYKTTSVTSLETERAQHVHLTSSPVTLTLSDDRQTTVVPAGRFRTNVFTAKWKTGLVRTWYVEADAPFRVIRWESSTGEHAELIASARNKYWQMNGEGGEQALESLGLTPRGPRMP